MGEIYSISLGGNANQNSETGLVLGSTYSGGSAYTSVTLSSIVTQVGEGGGGFRR